MMPEDYQIWLYAMINHINLETLRRELVELEILVNEN
jgi:hypothetical protein